MNQAQAATRAAVVIAAIGIAIAGCSGSTHAASGTAATANAGGTAVTATSPSTGPTTGPTSVPATGPTTGPTTPPSSPAAVPTLGQLTGDFAHGQGFGQVKPAKIFNGGDPTGLVTHLTWSSWGGPRAQATGTSEYVGPNQSVATGRPATAIVVAFDLGTCDGKLMYQAVEWYFPQHGQSFSPHHYENICTGSYVPAQ